MRVKTSLQTAVLTSALKNLKKELAGMSRGEKPFLARYRTARLHAFQLEFLAKFLRKSKPANTENFERLLLLSKDFEDRLGAFNETDEMIVYCEKHGVHLTNGESAAQHFKNQRSIQYRSLLKWLKSAGWMDRAQAQFKIAEDLIAGLEELDEKELRSSAVKKMVKVLREIQDNADEGAFSPRKSSGYVLKEVESKVHELRREIRKIPMYAGYLEGLFALTDESAPVSKKSMQALKFYSPLMDTPLAKSPFAKLPKASVEKPLLIPRPLYLAVTKYISELGFAKDWAQNIEKLREAGLPGEISFDQLDPSLQNIFGRPETFNAMTDRTISEIKETQIFRHMAENFEAQA